MNNSIQSIYNWYRNTLRHPQYRWWIILGTALYLVSPFDISPDFLPIVGQIDDVAIVTLLVAELSQMALDYFKTRQAEKTGEVAYSSDRPDTDTNTVEVEASTVNR